MIIYYVFKGGISMTKKEELEVLKEQLVQTRASIRLNSYGLIISTTGLAIYLYNYVNKYEDIAPLIAFSALTTLSAAKEIANFNKELKLRRKINELKG